MKPFSIAPADLVAAREARGFMPDEEGIALYRQGLQCSAPGPFLEIGSYCGKSAIYLGAAARDCGRVLFALDHHRGSEENQAGWEHHEPDLVDPTTGLMDTMPVFRRTIHNAGLEGTVVAIVGDSPTVAASWTTPLALVFIDGGHGEVPAHADYDGWAAKIVPGGTLVIHDVFADPADGGQPPYEVYLRALTDGFEETSATGSLRALRKPT